MITDIAVVRAPTIEEFNDKLEEGITLFYNNGCTDFDIQYKPLVVNDEFDCIIYTALLVGRS